MMLASNPRGTCGGGRIPLSRIGAGLPPLRKLKAASVGRMSGFFRSGTVSPSVAIVVLLHFPSDLGRILTTNFSRRESARQGVSGTSFRKVERRACENVNGFWGGQFFGVVECSIFKKKYAELCLPLTNPQASLCGLVSATPIPAGENKIFSISIKL
jgi:hypothetical protein